MLSVLCTFSYLVLTILEIDIIVSILRVKKQSQSGAVICPQTESVSNRARDLNPGPSDKTLPFAPHHSGLRSSGMEDVPDWE